MGYKVTWEISFEDEVNSPEEAAKLALDYIVNGTARVFNVETLDTGGKRMVVPKVTIDVDALEDEECETTEEKEGPCSLCGEPGVYTFDPYAHDIRGVLEYDYYCEACLHNMAQDI